MRSIKFRAYLHDYKTIAEVEFVSLIFNEIIARVEGGLYELELGEYELMQYTGLKDKNGKEIYEGDVIEFNNNGYQLTAGHRDEDIVIAEVEYSCGAWGLKEADGQLHDLYIVLVNDEEAEVIGNIYEDKHLLEESK